MAAELGAHNASEGPAIAEPDEKTDAHDGSAGSDEDAAEMTAGQDEDAVQAAEKVGAHAEEPEHAAAHAEELEVAAAPHEQLVHAGAPDEELAHADAPDEQPIVQHDYQASVEYLAQTARHQPVGYLMLWAHLLAGQLRPESAENLHLSLG